MMEQLEKVRIVMVTVACTSLVFSESFNSVVAPDQVII